MRPAKRVRRLRTTPSHPCDRSGADGNPWVPQAQPPEGGVSSGFKTRGLSRLCEGTGRANARRGHSSSKQSIFAAKSKEMDALPPLDALAMTEFGLARPNKKRPPELGAFAFLGLENEV